MRRFRVDKAKAVEAILYVAARLDDPSFHRISKILYFADLDHLERYGRLITGDTYYAMEYGPVPSYAYDAMKDARGNHPSSDLVANAFDAAGMYHVRPLREAAVDFFSKSELECFDAAIAERSDKSFGQLADESHDAAWHATAEDSPMNLDDIVSVRRQNISDRGSPDLREYLAHLGGHSSNLLLIV